MNKHGQPVRRYGWRAPDGREFVHYARTASAAAHKLVRGLNAIKLSPPLPALVAQGIGVYLLPPVTADVSRGLVDTRKAPGA